jgi:hypothetical protein
MEKHFENLRLSEWREWIKKRRDSLDKELVVKVNVEEIE